MTTKLPKFSLLARVVLLVFGALSLSACEYFQGMMESEEEVVEEARPIIFASDKSISSVPWFLAAEEGIFSRYNEEYNVNITFQEGEYDNIINQFVSGEIDVIVVSNIDAIARLVGRGIDSDAILISSYSDGNHAIMTSGERETGLMAGDSVLLKRFSASHYLLDRYLLKNLIGFGQVKLIDVSESEGGLVETYAQQQIDAVATTNPMLEQLRSEYNAKVLFDSHSIPRELMDLLVMRREALEESPRSARALLATWFTIMERLQGNRLGATLDTMATISGVSRNQFENQLASIDITNTATKALSRLRDRRMRKAMRHIRYFMERYELAGSAVVSNWVSYPGRTPALLHFNAQPLEEFVAPPEADALL